MIIKFQHKGLEAIYRRPLLDLDALPSPKLRRILAALDAATDPADLNLPAFRPVPLGGRLHGHWSIWVFGHWHLTFTFAAPHVTSVNYLEMRSLPPC